MQRDERPEPDVRAVHRQVYRQIGRPLHGDDRGRFIAVRRAEAGLEIKRLHRRAAVLADSGQAAGVLRHVHGGAADPAGAALVEGPHPCAVRADGVRFDNCAGGERRKDCRRRVRLSEQVGGCLGDNRNGLGGQGDIFLVHCIFYNCIAQEQQRDRLAGHGVGHVCLHAHHGDAPSSCRQVKWGRSKGIQRGQGGAV